MSTLTAYRALLRATGAGYLLVNFVARLPLAMSQIGVLLLVSDLTGSYGAGGACAGALAVASGIGAPWWGAMADRHGQRPILLVQALGAALAFVVVLVTAHSALPWAATAAASAVAGFLTPQVGPMSRVRWRPLLTSSAQQEKLVGTAFSAEGAADEASFVLGPTLVGLAVAVFSPTVALSAAAAMLAVFGTLFAVHSSATPGHPRDAQAHAGAGPLLSAALILLCTSQFVIGTVFGSVQTGTSALATATGHPEWTGFLHALLGVGSVIAGLAVPLLPARFTLAARLRAFAVALLLLSLPLLLVDSVGTLVWVLVPLGLSVAPYMITTFTAGEKITPPWRTGTVMTLLGAATTLGYAAGASIAGQLADLGGHRPAYLVTIGAGVLAVLVGSLGHGALRRAESYRPASEVLDDSTVLLGQDDGAVDVDLRPAQPGRREVDAHQ